MSIPALTSVLQQYFGYSTFRGNQEQIIYSVLDKRDTVVLMPTGGGKSLCYQVPSLVLKGVTIVISPLISLMKDQVDDLKASGIAAAYMNSSLTSDEIATIEQELKKNRISLLYLAPERLAKVEFQRFLSTLDISLVAVDEAHCISEWGHEFRVDYRELGKLRRTLFSRVPFIALTATATPHVAKDIVDQLHMVSPNVFQSSFDRTNLFYSVVPKQNTLDTLEAKLKSYSGESIIIYCFSRKDTESLSGYLNERGFQTAAYHAGLRKEEREFVQDEFKKDNLPIVVATVAFGMGIDKPNVRLVVHYHAPKSIEGYYQETGRAGRDGLPSECLLFYSEKDLANYSFFIAKIEEKDRKADAYEKVDKVRSFCLLSSCRRAYLLRYFGEHYPDNQCGNCDICTATGSGSVDVTVLAQKVLSAVVKTGQSFNGRYIKSLLFGKHTRAVEKTGHTSLSVFGIVSRKEERSKLHVLLEHLIELDYIRKNTDGVLKMTSKGIDFLKTKKTLKIKSVGVLDPVFNTKRQSISREVVAVDMKLFMHLRELRKSLADQQNQPAFVIFGDRTLLDIAKNKPTTLQQFSALSGVGKFKLEKYGQIFINAIKEYKEV